MAYVAASRLGNHAQASTVAFASVVATQLAQTVDLGRSGAGVDRSVTMASVASVGVLAATVLLAPLRGFLGLAIPTPVGLALIAAATASAPLLSRALPRALAPPSVRPPDRFHSRFTPA